MKDNTRTHQPNDAEMQRKLLFANLRRDSLKAWQAVAVPKVKRVARRYVVP